MTVCSNYRCTLISVSDMQKQIRACFLFRKAGSDFYLLFTILSLTTSINVSLPHLGQQRGNFTSTVSSYIFTSVFSLQAGHGIQCGVRFSLFIVLTSGFRIYEIGYIVLHISSNVQLFFLPFFTASQNRRCCGMGCPVSGHTALSAMRRHFCG